jgi:hypothetical protein
MANSSDAHGEVLLVCEWNKEAIDALNVVKGGWGRWDYSIDVHDDFDLDLMSSGFDGIGRWAISSNLECLDDWMRESFDKDPKLARAYKTLVSEMEKTGGKLEFTYTDEEAGCLRLCEGRVTLGAKDGKLVVLESLEECVPYTWDEYLDRYGQDDGFEELVRDLLSETVPELKDAFGGPVTIWTLKNKDRYATVREWAMKNTLPHASAYDLEEAKLAEVREIANA